eukprot:190552-Amphidinium_carterae.1
MKFLEEQKLGETELRNTVRSTIWTARRVHRVKGDGVRSRYVARQFKMIGRLRTKPGREVPIHASKVAGHRDGAR